MAKHDLVLTAPRSERRHRTSQPHAVEAHYDKRTGRIVVRLSNRLDIAFAPRDAQGLENATPAQLRDIELSLSGFGIHFPSIDADLYVPALLEGLLGSEKWMARHLGRRGGSAKSDAKAAAARKNGQLGGRPSKRSRAVA
jgi:hypothetical protein